ncbi:hypothetical protein TWF718_005990 [Orbilia javanica]|uniref:Uncharacterized protein n=1 Tax=Orbilia javanica TaxID=47235 RepID=A0AAN8RPB0_9PEZI
MVRAGVVIVPAKTLYRKPPAAGSSCLYRPGQFESQAILDSNLPAFPLPNPPLEQTSRCQSIPTVLPRKKQRFRRVSSDSIVTGGFGLGGSPANEHCKNTTGSTQFPESHQSLPFPPLEVNPFWGHWRASVISRQPAEAARGRFL